MFSSLTDSKVSSGSRLQIKRGMVFGIMIIAALLAFEMFNYSTTEYSLADLLGDLKFLGIHWATILSLAFCTIDFAGLARLFTPEQGADEPMEVWYLFGAWILAAIMNAMLTWWGVSVAIVNHTPSTNTLISRDIVLNVVPVFVALMVFLIRVLIIGTFSVAGERMFTQMPSRRGKLAGQRQTFPHNLPQVRPAPLSVQPSYRSAPKPVSAGQAILNRPEPSYHPLSVGGARPNQEDLIP